jgi:acetyltransferase
VRGSSDVWFVNPGRTEVLARQCFPTVAALPYRPEVALLLVGHRHIEAAFEESAEAGVRAFVIPGLGNEAGAERVAAVRRIARRARRLGAVVLGPNCMGAAVPGGTSLWLGTLPDHVVPGNVAAVVQSGLVGESLLALGPRIGFRCVVSTGGEAVTDTADVLAFLASDPGTRAIGLFLETVRRRAAFGEALAECSRRGKPVICLKVGRSQAAASTAYAHTGARVGSSRSFSSLVRACGAVEVADFPDFVETLEVLGQPRWPAGPRVGMVSESGGEAALLADHADAAGLVFPVVPARAARRLRAEFPNLLAASNPLDAWGIDAPERVFPRSLELFAHAGCFDVLVVHLGLSRFRGAWEQGWCRMIVQALIDAASDSSVVPVATTSVTADPPSDVQALARRHGVALLRGPGPAMRALATVARWSMLRRGSASAAGPGLQGREDEVRVDLGDGGG